MNWWRRRCFQDAICWLLTTATSYSIVLMSRHGGSHVPGLTPWLLGMSLMYVLQLATIFQWVSAFAWYVPITHLSNMP